MRMKILKIALGVAVIILLGVGYKYVFPSKENTTNKSPLVSSAQSPSTNSTSSASASKTVSKDTQFLSTLLGLSKINIDKTIFENKSFSLLEDNNVKVISDGVVGRDNPFAPFESSANVLVPAVSTLEASQITSNSAVLSGALGTGINSNDIFFKWGTSKDKVDRILLAESESFVGTFSKNLTGLSSKTNYYFRAVAKVGGREFTGEIISFTTK